jgi:hypothetical protein
MTTSHHACTTSLPHPTPRFLTQRLASSHNASSAGKVPWASICTLKKLEELDMRLNIKLNPSVVPAELSQLAKLKILDLTKMNLCEHLPWDAICMLTKLEGIRCASRCMRLRVAFSLSFCVLILRAHFACSLCVFILLAGMHRHCSFDFAPNLRHNTP